MIKRLLISAILLGTMLFAISNADAQSRIIIKRNGQTIMSTLQYRAGSTTFHPRVRYHSYRHHRHHRYCHCNAYPVARRRVFVRRWNRRICR